jgi:polysaccharide export outer membrane protein
MRIMSTNIFASLTLTLAFASALHVQPAQAAPSQAQQPPPAQRLPAKPPATKPPPVVPPFKPDFEIPIPEGTLRPATPPAQTEGYVIGAQDNLSIIVSDEAELTGKYRVDTDGTISMPYLSRVLLAGLSLADAQVKIAGLLQAGYIRNPQVRIEVDQFKARSVIVSGEVRTPGKVTLPGTTMSLLEALALAGSPTVNASNEVIVIHPPKPGEHAPEPITINRRELEVGKAGRDITLQDGDIVNVPVAKRFYISGFVKNPGSYVMDTGTTVSQAIVLAGGLSERGTDRRLKVSRLVDGKTVDVSVELDDRLQPNDEIKIRSRFF